ncbi:MAG: hypothetical protein Q7S06_01325 [Nanoarchaeota archaeon]|nr:hypothetical protein [Nanoarchaeota archaeon]
MEEDKRYTMAGWLMKERTEKGYDIEIPSLGVVIPGNRKLSTDRTQSSKYENVELKKR